MQPTRQRRLHRLLGKSVGDHPAQVVAIRGIDDALGRDARTAPVLDDVISRAELQGLNCDFLAKRTRDENKRQIGPKLLGAPERKLAAVRGNLIVRQYDVVGIFQQCRFVV